MNLPTCIPFFPPNKHCLVLLLFHFFVEIHFLQSRAARALSLTLGHHGLVTKIQHPPCHSPTSVWLGTKFLLQAAAGRGHLGSRSASSGGHKVRRGSCGPEQTHRRPWRGRAKTPPRLSLCKVWTRASRPELGAGKQLP